MGDGGLIEAFDARAKRRADRRAFFGQALGVAAVGGAMIAGGRAAAQSATPTPTPSPSATATGNLSTSDYLNFALNLEYLEANFYAFATTGQAISTIPGSTVSLVNGVVTTGAQGTATGGRAVNFTDPIVAQFAREIAADELAHVAFLRAAIGRFTVAQPAIDLSPGGAFSTAARAAGLIQAGQTFDPYANDENFLLASFLFEDVGVTAYKGATPLLSGSTVLEATQGILAVEAYHAAMIRATLYRKGIETPSLGLIEATQRISDARDRLDGTNVTEDINTGYAPDSDQGLANAGEPVANIMPLNSNGLAYSRTANRVLNILYLNQASVGTGGFFPAGVNGAIRTSANAT